MIQDSFFLFWTIKDTGGGMGDVQHFKGCSLFDFILGKFIGVKAGKRGFAHGIEDVCIKCRGVIYFFCPPYSFPVPGAVIAKIGLEPQGLDARPFFQASADGYGAVGFNGVFMGGGHLVPAQDLIWLGFGGNGQNPLMPASLKLSSR